MSAEDPASLASLTVRHLGLESVSTRAGGLNRYLAALVAAERRDGIDASAVVLGQPDDPSHAPTAPALARAWTRSLPFRIGAMARAASKRPLPTIVDSHFALYAALPIRTSLARIPLVVHFQGPWAQESDVEGEGGLVVRLKRLVERSVYSKADSVVVLSHAFGSIAEETYGVSPFRVHRIAPGVDLTTFSPGDPEAARRRLRVSPDTTVLVCVRRLRPRMGIEVAIRAVAEVASSRRVELVVVGEGPERQRLSDLAERLGAPVRFVGRVSDEELVDWYRAAELSVVPTVALEGYGLVVLESFASGTPVIASNLGGLCDALEQVSPELLVDPGDPSALARAIDGALDGTRAVPTPGQCRQHAEQHSWDAVARRHRRLYDAVLERRRGGERPRVVFVGHSAALSGGELAMARLLSELAVLCEVRVILAEQGPLVGRLEAEGIEVEVLALDEGARALKKDRVGRGGVSLAVVLGTARGVWSLRRRLRQLKPDIVHTNTLKAALYGAMAARLARVPVVIWHLRDRMAEDYLPRRAIQLVRFAAPRLADGVIANSTATLEALSCPTLPSTVIASPLDASIQAHEPRVSGELVVGVVGRLAPWKGQLEFLDAFKSAFPEGGARARIIGAALFGEEEYEAQVRARIAALFPDGRVEMRGFQDDIAAELDGLDVLVHSSIIPEPFGQVVVEGMASGVCVIAADAGGPASIITDGHDGVLYPMGDVAALSACLVMVAGDRERCARLARAGIESAQRYRVPALAASTLAFYQERRGG